MRRFVSDMNPFVRGLLVVALVALVIVVLQLYQTLFALQLLARIAFFLAIAFFIYLVWRERREDIAAWSSRSQAVFYGGALLIVADLGSYFLLGASGPDALAFLLVLVLAGFSMFRVWRDERRYSL
jgi:small-conductance mechanosensitive channel